MGVGGCVFCFLPHVTSPDFFYFWLPVGIWITQSLFLNPSSNTLLFPCACYFWSRDSWPCFPLQSSLPTDFLRGGLCSIILRHLQDTNSVLSLSWVKSLTRGCVLSCLPQESRLTSRFWPLACNTPAMWGSWRSWPPCLILCLNQALSLFRLHENRSQTILTLPSEFLVQFTAL